MFNEKIKLDSIVTSIGKQDVGKKVVVVLQNVTKSPQGRFVMQLSNSKGRKKIQFDHLYSFITYFPSSSSSSTYCENECFTYEIHPSCNPNMLFLWQLCRYTQNKLMTKFAVEAIIISTFVMLTCLMWWLFCTLKLSLLKTM